MQFGQTIIAGEEIRRHMNLYLAARLAAADREIGQCFNRNGFDANQMGCGKRRGASGQRITKGILDRSASLGVDFDPPQLILHPTIQPVFNRQAVHEGPETDALHVAVQAPVARLQRSNTACCLISRSTRRHF